MGYYAVSDQVSGPYEHRSVVGDILQQLDSGFAHGDFFQWRGDWYHVWCRYRDRAHDRIRDCFTAPVRSGDDGTMWDDLTELRDLC